MPTTVNGVGTHYYGKKNQQTRQAQCRSCGYYGPLNSYDTRLWFVVIFIPVIPLGRKRILDDCPRCRRHYSLKADEFEVASQLNVSEGREKYLREPTVESALEAHGRMLGFHQHSEADAFRSEVLERFPRDANLRASLASHLDQVSRHVEAEPLYAEAFQLDPALPDARVGVAFTRMNEGKLDEARGLLDYLEKPGAGEVYSLGPLHMLATLYQQKNLHQKALDIFRHLLNESPDAAKNPAFRKTVQLSEKKLRTQESLLPPRQGSSLGVFNPWNPEFSSGQKTWAFLGLVSVLIAAGMAANNEYIRRHRTIHIVSGLREPATVKVDDLPPIQVSETGQVTVPEGLHRVTVSGPVEAQYEVPVESSYWSRWSRNPVWIVNIAGTAGLMQMQYHYAANPTPPTWNVLAGQTVIARPHIDYPFVEPPDSVEVPSKTAIVTKTGMMVAPGEPRNIVRHVADPGQALTFLEAHLAGHGNELLLFHEYEERVKAQKAEKRGEAFLEKGLARRPIEVSWHRSYQNLLEEQGRIDELTRRYEELAAAEPNDSSALYLRSRIEGDATRRMELLTKARDLDPKNPWPWYGLGYQPALQGDWPAAQEALQAATDRGLDPELTRRMLAFVRLGNGESQKIIEEARAALAKEPASFTGLAVLADALTSAGKGAEALQELQGWKSRNAAIASRAGAALDSIRFMVLYGMGDLATLKQECSGSSDPDLQLWKSAAALAGGDLDSIVSNPSLVPGDDKPWDALALSAAYHLAHDDAKSEEWLGKACRKLKERGIEERIVGNALTSTTPPDFAVIRELATDLTQKLVLLCAVAQQFPALEPECRALAEKINLNHMPPYQLVRKVFPPKE